MTKLELKKIRTGYQSYRSAIRRHAQCIFTSSNNIKSCAKCGYDRHIEIAHIRPVSSFPDTSIIGEINKIDNLIALCPTHHWEYDHGILKI
jgi:predicted restriction endonuclease